MYVVHRELHEGGKAAEARHVANAGDGISSKTEVLPRKIAIPPKQQ